MQTRNATGNLVNRYKAVLKKCNLINVFGTLAVATMLASPILASEAFAATNPAGSTLNSTMEATGSDPVLVNNGTIIIEKVGTTENYVRMYGMYTGNTNTDSIFTNNGIMNLTAIGSKVTTSNVNNVTADSWLYGMSLNNGNHTVNNTGTMNLTGIGGTATAISSLHGIIMFTASASVSISGMNISDGNSTINNSGTMNIIAKGGTADVQANEINSSSASGQAYGINITLTDVSNTIASNSGTINVQVTGGNITSTQTSGLTSAQAKAWGMNILYGHHTIKNTGTINVTAIGGNATTTTAGATSLAEAIGLYGFSRGNHTLSNSGIINVTAISGIANGSSPTAHAYAYGMQISGQASGVHRVSNTGIISASATVKDSSQETRAYEVYGLHNFTVDTWATTLKDWTANDAVFGVNNGDIITFANATNSGATLILRPGSTAQGFQLGKSYEIAKMVAIENNADIMEQQTAFASGKIEGSIAKATTEVPFLVANLGGTATAPTVSLSVNPAGLPNNAATAQAGAVVQGQMTNISAEIRNSIAIAYLNAIDAPVLTASLDDSVIATNNQINQWSYFGNLYGSYTNNGRYDTDSKGFGLTTGASKKVDELLTAGFHLDMNVTDSDAGAMSNYLKSLAFGGHANYFIDSNVYVGASATYALGINDAKYRAGVDVAQDHYNSHALFMVGNIGYIYEMDENNIMMPEIGLSYLYSYTNDYAFYFATVSGYNMNVHSNAYSALYADFKLKWQGNIQRENGFITPSASFGFRQTLAGADIDSSIDMFGTRYENTANSDSTSVLTGVGLSYTSDNLTLGASYDVAFGGNQHSHKGSLDLVYRF